MRLLLRLMAVTVLIFLCPTNSDADTPVATIKTGKIQLKNTSNKFDNYGSRYRYLEADKDCQVVTFDFTATSKDKNPMLPPLYVAQTDDNGNITAISVMDIMFKKWEDYATFLGNYHDSKNDFAKSDSVQFVAFAQVYRNKGPYIVFTDETGCYARKEDRWKNPPVEYVAEGMCATNPPKSLAGVKVLDAVKPKKR